MFNSRMTSGFAGLGGPVRTMKNGGTAILLFIWAFYSACIYAGNSLDGNNYEVGANVQAAISHFTQQVRAAPENSEFVRHLFTALRFAGRLEECIEV
jgi:hypothetical protein